jgi:hypothetical protein
LPFCVSQYLVGALILSFVFGVAHALASALAATIPS